MVKTQNVVIDDAFDEIEGAPADQETAEVSAPGRGEFTPLPGSRGSDRTRQDCDPSGHVKEPVREGVVLQTTDGASRTTPFVREQVVPLEDLVKEDAVDESAEADAHEEGREERWTDPVGHWPATAQCRGGPNASPPSSSESGEVVSLADSSITDCASQGTHLSVVPRPGREDPVLDHETEHPRRARRTRLSVRERQVFSMLALGATGLEVAEALYLSPETVRSHTRTARRKLGARTRSQALALAIKSGQIDVRDPSGGAR